MTTKPYKRISRRNFEKLRKQQKRVAVARDVIARLELGTIKATPGTYLALKSATLDMCNTPESRRLDKILNKEPCEACAIGGAFTAYVGIVDGLSLDRMRATVRLNKGITNFGEDDLREKLGEIFGSHELDTIERAFEGWSWGEVFSQAPKERLVAIMKNIIRHRGYFRPEREQPSE